MNYSKLDPRLAAVMSEHPDSDERTRKVSVRTQEPPNDEQQRELKSFGVYGASDGDPFPLRNCHLTVFRSYLRSPGSYSHSRWPTS